jgi:hypothetical protein
MMYARFDDYFPAPFTIAVTVAACQQLSSARQIGPVYPA